MAKSDSIAPVQRLRNWAVRHFGRVVVLPALVAVMFLYDAALAHCEPSRLTPYSFYGTLHAADFASTEIALARGGFEANPAMRSRGGRVAFKAVAVVGMSELDRVLSRRGKRKAVWAIRAGTLVLYSYAVAHNLRVK